jgi:hypothetical protein
MVDGVEGLVMVVQVPVVQVLVVQVVDAVVIPRTLLLPFSN